LGCGVNYLSGTVGLATCQGSDKVDEIAALQEMPAMRYLRKPDGCYAGSLGPQFPPQNCRGTEGIPLCRPTHRGRAW
jgi:hypothetical protein